MSHSFFVRALWTAVLLSIIWYSPFPAAASDDFLPMLLQDTLAGLVERLAQEGRSGTKTEIELPARSFRVDLEPEEPGLPSVYVVERGTVRAEVETWSLAPDAFSADRIVFSAPEFKIYQGSPESVKRYYRNELHRALPASATDDLIQRYAPDANPSGFDILRLIQNPKARVNIGRLEVREGVIEGIDSRSAAAVTARLQTIQLTIQNLILPPSSEPRRTRLEFKIASAEPGFVALTLIDETTPEGKPQFKFSGAIEQLDLAYFAPFLPLEEGWKIERGVVGLTASATCEAGFYSAYHHLVLGNLSIQPGKGDSLAESWALQRLVQAGQALGDKVQLDFPIEGDLTDPRFDLEEAYNDAIEDSLVRWTTLQTLRKLGLEDSEFLKKKLGVSDKEEKSK